MELKTVDQIVERYNDEAEQAEARAKSEDGCHAEFCSSLCYGDFSFHQMLDDAKREFEPETLDAIKAHAAKHGKRVTLELMAENSALRLVGIYRVGSEWNSVALGEIEEQPSDELLAAYLALSPEEQEQVRKRADVYISDSTCKGFMYINCDYDRFVLCLDEESFVAAATEQDEMKGA